MLDYVMLNMFYYSQVFSVSYLDVPSVSRHSIPDLKTARTPEQRIREACQTRVANILSLLLLRINRLSQQFPSTYHLPEQYFQDV